MTKRGIAKAIHNQAGLFTSTSDISHLYLVALKLGGDAAEASTLGYFRKRAMKACAITILGTTTAIAFNTEFSQHIEPPTRATFYIVGGDICLHQAGYSSPEYVRTSRHHLSLGARPAGNNRIPHANQEGLNALVCMP